MHPNPAPRYCPQCLSPMRIQGATLCGDRNDWIAYQCDKCGSKEIFFPNRQDNIPAPMFHHLLGPGAPRPNVDRDKNVIHLVNAPNGHVMSVDCWCEPVSIQWIVNKHGIRVLVVDHVDDTILDRALVLAKRNELRGTPATGNMASVPINQTHEAPWITRVLNDV